MAYTAARLQQYAYEEVREWADLLGWTVAGGRFVSAVKEAARAVAGTADPATATDDDATDALLEAEAVAAVLRRVVVAVGTRYDLSTDGQSLSRGQLKEGAQLALAEAERRVAALGGGASVVLVGRWRVTADPYQHLPDDLRVIA